MKLIDLVTVSFDEKDQGGLTASCADQSFECEDSPCYEDCTTLGHDAKEFRDTCGDLWIEIYECFANMPCEGVDAWRTAQIDDTFDYPRGKLESEFRESCPDIPLYGPNSLSLVLRGALLLALLLAALLLGAGRRALIRQCFVDGAVPGDAPVWPRHPEGPGLEPVARVVLLDGLSRAYAATLPHLSELCTHGQELQVDVGFPTVSLPIQQALWTGLTQQQSGVRYHLGQLAEGAGLSPRLRLSRGRLRGSC